MGIWENIKGINRSLKLRHKESLLGRGAVVKGSQESRFLTDYETFKVGLLIWLENIIIDKGHKSVVLRPKEESGYAKYFRYTLEDTSITNTFDIEKRPGGEWKYTIKGNIEELLEDVDEEVEDQNIMYF